MKLIYLFLLFISCYCETEIDPINKLSNTDTIQLIKLIDDLNYNNCLNFEKIEMIPKCKEYLNIFQKTTGQNLTKENFDLIRNKLYKLLDSHINQTSWYAKYLGLITFTNILLFCAVISTFLFSLFLLRDIIIKLGLMGFYIAYLLLNIFFTFNMICFYGMILSILTLCFKPEDMINTKLSYIYIFDNYTPLFGLLIFGATSILWYSTNFNKVKVYPSLLISLWTLISAITAIYHNNWIIGVVTVWLIFTNIGFSFGSMTGGFYTGFKNDDVIGKCLILSIILVSGFLILKTNAINFEYSKYLLVFETGVLFWATFVGCLAMLILSDIDYIKTKCKKIDAFSFVFMQFLMVGLCLTVMYFGNMLYIECLKNIGGTFLFLWALDLERIILRNFRTANMTGIFFVTSLNLMGLRYYIMNYPEYFIF